MSEPVKWCTAEEAIRRIRPGQRVFVGSGCAEPQTLIEALCQHGRDFHHVEMVHLLTSGDASYVKPEFDGNFRHNAFFIGSNVRAAVREGRADYTPIFLSEIPDLIRGGGCTVDVALLQVSPPDARGFCSLGIHVDIQRAALESARLVIAEVNARMPRTFGDTVVHLDQIDLCVKVDRPLLQLPAAGPPTDVEMAIASHIATLVNDGSCLQLGIGKIPDAVLRYLTDKRHLGIHTEMFSDGLVDLYESGAIDNSQKEIDRGYLTTSFVMGTQRLYDFVHENPVVLFRPSDVVNDPRVVARNDQVVSINSALQVDLTGQVCADSLGYTFFSGIGGQVDFTRGAAMSRGGKPIIALPSTAKGGTVSRIVPHLDEGAGVVTSRGDVHYVATEHGIAYLHGKTIRDRALQLAHIAHPDFRSELLDSIRRVYAYPMSDEVWEQFSQPYPAQVRKDLDFDGLELEMRPLKVGDERALQKLFYSHTPETIHQRYFYMKQSMGEDEAMLLCSVDYSRRMALGLFSKEGAGEKLVAVARYELDPRRNVAETAVVVAEDQRGRGLARRLLEELEAYAEGLGIEGFESYVLASSTRMLKYHRRRGHDMQWNPEDRLYRVSYSFRAAKTAVDSTK